MDPYFIDRHKSTKKLIRIAFEIGKKFAEMVTRMRFWSSVSNRSTHLAQSFLMHKRVYEILTIRSLEMDTLSAILRTFIFGSFETISWILLIISGVVISFGRPGLGIVSVLVQPLLNYSIR